MKTMLKAVRILWWSALCASAVEPSATLFENDDVKVVRALEKAHVKGGFHEHKVNRVMVYLQDGRQRFEYQDGRKPAVFDWKAGQVVWSPSDGMHSPEVVSDEPFNIIEVELKKPAGVSPGAPPSSADVPRLDSGRFKPEFENVQVRVVRLKLGPHETASLSGGLKSCVTVFLTDQDVRVTGLNRNSVPAKHKAGEAVWESPGAAQVENVGISPLEMLFIELRR